MADQSLHLSVDAPSPVNSLTGNLDNASSSCLRVPTHASDITETIHDSSPADSCWGWLQPAPECSKNVLHHVVLHENLIGIGREADAFDRAMRQHVPKAFQSTEENGGGASSSSKTDEAISETGDSVLPEVSKTFVEVLGGRLRDISRNGTFLNGKKISPGEDTPLSDGDRISLVYDLGVIGGVGSGALSTTATALSHNTSEENIIFLVVNLEEAIKRASGDMLARRRERAAHAGVYLVWWGCIFFGAGPWPGLASLLGRK